MNLAQLLDQLKNDRAFMENVTAWKTIEKQPHFSAKSASL